MDQKKISKSKVSTETQTLNEEPNKKLVRDAVAQIVTKDKINWVETGPLLRETVMTTSKDVLKKLDVSTMDLTDKSVRALLKQQINAKLLKQNFNAAQMSHWSPGTRIVESNFGSSFTPYEANTYPLDDMNAEEQPSLFGTSQPALKVSKDVDAPMEQFTTKVDSTPQCSPRFTAASAPKPFFTLPSAVNGDSNRNASTTIETQTEPFPVAAKCIKAKVSNSETGIKWQEPKPNFGGSTSPLPTLQSTANDALALSMILPETTENFAYNFYKDVQEKFQFKKQKVRPGTTAEETQEKLFSIQQTARAIIETPKLSGKTKNNPSRGAWQFIEKKNSLNLKPFDPLPRAKVKNVKSSSKLGKHATQAQRLTAAAIALNTQHLSFGRPMTQALKSHAQATKNTGSSGAASSKLTTTLALDARGAMGDKKDFEISQETKSNLKNAVDAFYADVAYPCKDTEKMKTQKLVRENSFSFLFPETDGDETLEELASDTMNLFKKKLSAEIEPPSSIADKLNARLKGMKSLKYEDLPLTEASQSVDVLSKALIDTLKMPTSIESNDKSKKSQDFDDTKMLKSKSHFLSSYDKSGNTSVDLNSPRPSLTGSFKRTSRIPSAAIKILSPAVNRRGTMIATNQVQQITPKPLTVDKLTNSTMKLIDSKPFIVDPASTFNQSFLNGQNTRTLERKIIAPLTEAEISTELSTPQGSDSTNPVKLETHTMQVKQVNFAVQQNATKSQSVSKIADSKPKPLSTLERAKNYAKDIPKPKVTPKSEAIPLQSKKYQPSSALFKTSNNANTIKGCEATNSSMLYSKPVPVKAQEKYNAEKSPTKPSSPIINTVNDAKMSQIHAYSGKATDSKLSPSSLIKENNFAKESPKIACSSKVTKSLSSKFSLGSVKDPSKAQDRVKSAYIPEYKPFSIHLKGINDFLEKPKPALFSKLEGTELISPATKETNAVQITPKRSSPLTCNDSCKTLNTSSSNVEKSRTSIKTARRTQNSDKSVTFATDTKGALTSKPPSAFAKAANLPHSPLTYNDSSKTLNTSSSNVEKSRTSLCKTARKTQNSGKSVTFATDTKGALTSKPPSAFAKAANYAKQYRDPFIDITDWVPSSPIVKTLERRAKHDGSLSDFSDNDGYEDDTFSIHSLSKMTLEPSKPLPSALNVAGKIPKSFMKTVTKPSVFAALNDEEPIYVDVAKQQTLSGVAAQSNMKLQDAIKVKPKLPAFAEDLKVSVGFYPSDDDSDDDTDESSYRLKTQRELEQTKSGIEDGVTLRNQLATGNRQKVAGVCQELEDEDDILAKQLEDWKKSRAVTFKL